MTRLLAALMVAWVCVPALAGAVRLTPELRVSGGWDSNVNNSEFREESSLVGGLGARFTLESERNVPFTWSLSYDGIYEDYQTSARVDQYRQTATGKFQTPLGAATVLSGNARFSQTYDTGSGQFSSTSSTQGAVTRGSDRIDQTLVTLGLNRGFGPRWSGDFSTTYSAIRYNSRTRADLEVIGAVANLTYSLTRRQTVGGGLSVTRQTIESIGISPEQSTDFTNAFVSWNYLMSPRWSLQSRIGPTFIRAEEQDGPSLRVTNGQTGFTLVPLATPNRGFDARTCPSIDAAKGTVFLSVTCSPTSDPLPPGTDLGHVDALVLTNPQEFETENDSLTTFANLSLVRQGELSSWSTSLIRRDGGNLGGRTSTVLTALSSTFRWEPAKRWELTLSGHYSKQESATDTSQIVGVFEPARNDPNLPDGTAVRVISETNPNEAERQVIKLDNAVDVDTWSLRFAATRRITSKLSGRMDVAYRNQDNSSEVVTTANSFEDWRVGFSLIYRFDPIAF